MTNKPERTCVACRKKGTKENFIKIVKNKNNEICLEKDQKLDGRGAYICKSETCARLALKTKALNRVFKTVVPAEVYEELINEFVSNKN